MKVILKKDVPGAGQAGEVKDVANGFARNKLIPQGLAEFATPEKVAAVEAEQAHVAGKRKAEEEQLAQATQKLAGAKITIKEKANEKGRLFSSVHVDRLLDALKAQAGVEVPPSALSSFEPVKEAGEYEVKVSAGEKEEKFTLVVEAA